MSVRFRFDWVDAGPSPDRIARATMAALSISVGDVAITSVLDRGNRLYSDTVVVPLFGVAEWLVANWWHVWYEIEDTTEQRPEFESRHDLSFAGDGFALPRLTLVPDVGRMKLQWTPCKPRYARVEFIGEGRENVAREELETELRNLVDAVIERLHGRSDTVPAADELGRAWNAINGLDPDELEFSRAAALLGMDPFDVRDEVADRIVTFWEHAPPSVREDALAGASADSLNSVAAWLEDSLATLATNGKGDDWPAVRDALPRLESAEPWTRGYALARATRERIRRTDGPIDLVEHGPLAIPRRETRPPTRRIHGLVAADAPACVTAPRGRTGTRFLMARALGDYLARASPGPGLLSSLSTDRQAQSRAFAAEFLAPAEALRARLAGDSPVEPERTDDLAREFDVSSEVIRRQIRNHDLARIVEY